MKEHERSHLCWCGPRYFEVCTQCRPFREDTSFERERAVASALAVRQPLAGIRAMRPKAAKGCWKCDGYGLVEVKEWDEAVEHVYTHRGMKEPENGDDSDAG